MVLPWSDGNGFLPDTKSEVALDIVIIVFVSLIFAFFTGLDAQVAYMTSSPVQYFSSNTASDVESLKLSSEQVGDINFASKNRLGFTSSGDEIGLCSGVRSTGQIFDLRVAEGFEDTSRTSVRFSCVQPRELVMHSQPGYSKSLSAEDKSFEGEFKPRYSCIVYGELAASPVSGEVGGLSCWSVGDTGEFTDVSVFLKD